jgi:hypothetical protein
MLCLGLGIVLATRGSDAEEDAPEKLRVEVVGEALSIEVGDAAVGEVLREVARQAQFAVATYGNLGLARAQRFEGVPLEDAIQRLVGDNRVNLIMRYEIDAEGERRLVEVTARAAGDVPAALLEGRRMRAELARIRVPPPPPPPVQ